MGLVSTFLLCVCGSVQCVFVTPVSVIRDHYLLPFVKCIELAFVWGNALYCVCEPVA